LVKRRILVIDDDDDIRAVVGMSLEAVGGHTVLTASSGEEGLLVAAGQDLDAIVLDVMMPGLDGPSTFKRLREQQATRHIPVVMLTAKGAESMQYVALGVAAVISKPFDPMTLPDQLAQALGWA
jgi:CheY-like chemotaxis protein